MRIRFAILLLLILSAGFLFWGYWQATRDPIVRSATVSLPGWPAGEKPVRAVLLSDLHVAGPDMPPERLARIVAQANSLRPDIVMIAGDLVSDKNLATRHYPADEAVAPLKGLRAPLGTVAVLGNHDHWRDAAAFHRALPQAGVSLLANQAIRRGPLAIGGIDDDFSGHARIARTMAALRALDGPRIALSHSPDIAPELPADMTLVLAGHTHCGQISLPLIGRLATASRHGERYACGRISEGTRTIIVGAGLGTSILPLRYGVPPDLWLVTLGP